MNQKPFVTFDRKKPESYWDEFFIDFTVVMLPYLGLAAGLAILACITATTGAFPFLLLPLVLTLSGLGMVVKTLFVYGGIIFPNLSVAALLGHVKVSPVRPVTATITGKIVGKGVPGLVFSEDFVLRDNSGILFLDYQQPLAIWNLLFGLLRAERYQGKEVRVIGWFRRQPLPYLEVYKLEVIDGSEPPRKCYSFIGQLIFSALIAVLGIGGMVLTWKSFN